MLQPITGSRNRFITKVRLEFDGRDPLDVGLDVSSRSAPGQTIDIGSHTFTTLSIEILDTDVGYRPSYKGISPVGFAELDVAGAKVDEVVHLPTDLLTAAGTSSIDHPLDVVMTRQRSNPAEPARTDDEETSIQRAFDLPTARTFAVDGDARLSARAPDTVLDTLLGRPDAGGRWRHRDVHGPARRRPVGARLLRHRRRPDDGMADAVRVRAGQRDDLHVGRAVLVRPSRSRRCSRTVATRCRPSSRSPLTTARRWS